MTVRRWVALPAVVGIVAALAGCSDDGGSSKAGPDLKGEVVFAVLAPSERTGPLGERGRDLIRGAKLAAAELNGRNGVLGKRLVLNVIDDACTTSVAYEAAKGVAEDSDISGAVGGICDEATAREVAVVDASGIPFLVTSANGAKLITPDVKSAYLMNGTIYQQALSTVYWMNYRHAQRLAVVADAGAASQALVKNVITLIDQAPELVSLQKVPVGKTDLAVAAKAALASHPNFVFWAGGPAGGGALAAALHKAGYKGTFTASAASESPKFLAAAHGGADGAFVTATSTATNTPTAKKWLARFRDTYHRDPGLDALQGYDAIRTLARAARQAHSTEPKAIAAQVPKLSTDFTTFLGVVRFARDHTLLYDNRIILTVKNDAFTYKRSLRTDSLQ
jgi:branched-chain amino acid transport system substrate-binding protein